MKKNYEKLLLMLLIFTLCIGFMPIQAQAVSSKATVKISLNKSRYVSKKGEKLKLKAAISPAKSKTKIKKKKQTKTQYLCTTLVEKTNSAYKFHLSSGVAYKVELKKKEVVIHGSVSKMNKSGTLAISGTVSNIGRHTYKLAKKVKYLSRGGDAPDIKFTKSGFKKYLKTAKNSQLDLILQIKNKKIIKIVIGS